MRAFEGSSTRSILLPLVIFWMMSDPGVLAQTRVSLAVGEALIVKVRGTPRAIATSFLPAGGGLVVGNRLSAGDRIETSPSSSLTLELSDGSTIEVEPNTQLELLGFNGGIRELFRIWLGKVRLKVHKLVGSASSYEMHSPIATIGVRGTQFEIIVLANSVTTVRVYEGLVSVQPRQVRSGEVLVAAGRELTVYPMRIPGSPVPFERMVAEGFKRESSADPEFDAVLEPAELPTVERFLAFEDRHFDVLENPAFASREREGSGRLYLFGARATSFFKPQISALSSLDQIADVKTLFAIDRRLREGASSQFGYLYPLGKWVVGGVHQYRESRVDFNLQVSRRLPTVFGEDIRIEQQGDSVFAPNLAHDTHIQRGMMVLSRRFSNQALAFSFDWVRSSGGIQTEYAFQPNGITAASERTDTRFRNQSKKLAIGYLRDTRFGSFSAYYRYGFLSGQTQQQEHLLNGIPDSLARFHTQGFTQEAGIKWRKSLSSNWAIAGVGSVLYSRLDESIRHFRIADSNERTGFWVPSVGVGLGGILGDHVHLALDYRFSAIHEFSHRSDAVTGSALEFLDENRFDHAIHSWIHSELPARFFTGTGITSVISSEGFQGSFSRDSLGRRVDSRGRPRPALLSDLARNRFTQFGFSFGRRIGRDFLLEYVGSATAGGLVHPFNHSLILRFSF